MKSNSPQRLPQPFLLLLPLLIALVGGLPAAESDRDKDPDSTRFFASNQVIQIKIAIAPLNVSALQREPREYVSATVWEGGTQYPDVALRLKGSKLGSFRPLDEKPALTLNFDKFVEGRKFHGLDKVYLNNSVEDPSYMSEHLCSALFREAGVPAPRISFARVEINGTDRGLYVLKEGFDKEFLKGWFDDIDGHFYEGDNGEDVTASLKLSSGNRKGAGQDLKALAAAASEPEPEQRWVRLGEVLDRERFISFLALEVMTGHWDGYGMNRNNYRLYHDPTTDKLIFMPHGMDLMFEHAEGPVIPEFQGLVARAIIGTEPGRARYLARIKELRSQVLTEERMTAQIDAIQARLRPALEAIDPAAATAHDREVRLLRKRIAERLQLFQSNPQ